jgi:DNA-binding ferritin-like protein (Dps family)
LAYLVLQPSHAELQAVRRELLTESNLLYCSDPNGMHIIDYNATADPKAVENLRADILKTDWRENLKHVEPTKDASAPAIDRMFSSLVSFLLTRSAANQSYEDAVKGKGAAGFTRDALKDQIKKTDWRENLKHTEPAKDASAPAIDRMRFCSSVPRFRSYATCCH